MIQRIYRWSCSSSRSYGAGPSPLAVSTLISSGWWASAPFCRRLHQKDTVRRGRRNKLVCALRCQMHHSRFETPLLLQTIKFYELTIPKARFAECVHYCNIRPTAVVTEVARSILGSVYSAGLGFFDVTFLTNLKDTFGKFWAKFTFGMAKISDYPTTPGAWFIWLSKKIWCTLPRKEANLPLLQLFCRCVTDLGSGQFFQSQVDFARLILWIFGNFIVWQ